MRNNMSNPNPTQDPIEETLPEDCGHDSHYEMMQDEIEVDNFKEDNHVTRELNY